MKSSLKVWLLAALMAFSAPQAALAVATTIVTVNNATWTLLGAGPLQITPSSAISYAISDAPPSIPIGGGFKVSAGATVIANSPSNIYAAVTGGPPTVNVYIAPLPPPGTATFTWPGSCGNGVINTPATAGCTVPYINAYVIGGGGGGGGGGFTPALAYSTPLSVTVTSSHTPFPAGTAPGSTIIVYNTGPNVAFWTVGPSGSVVATTAMAQITPNSPISFIVPTGATDLAAITKAGQTAIINMELGTGTPAFNGGPINLSITPAGSTTSFATITGALDNGGVARVLQTTAPGTAATADLLGVQGAPNGAPIPISQAVSHGSTAALAAALAAKTSAGSLFGFNCAAITGAAAGYCVAYNSASTPGTGALTGSLVLDFCGFDTTSRGCSLSRAPTSAAYSAGIQILVTSAASPYTYTTGTDTAAVSADFQ